MVGRVASLRPISTSTITINNLSTIVKRRVDDLFRSKSTSSTTNIYITPLIVTIVFQQEVKQQSETKIYHAQLGYGKESGWSETYIHLSHHHEHFNQKDENKIGYPTIYHAHLGYGTESGWDETYLHISHHNQHLLHNCERKNGWSLETHLHLLHSHHFDHHGNKLNDCERKIG